MTYFRWWGFSINEGSGPVNIHVSWFTTHWLFFYIFAFGWRWHWEITRRKRCDETPCTDEDATEAAAAPEPERTTKGIRHYLRSLPESEANESITEFFDQVFAEEQDGPVPDAITYDPSVLQSYRQMFLGYEADTEESYEEWSAKLDKWMEAEMEEEKND